MRAAAILTGPVTHLDHLGVLSKLLEIPLIVTEEKHIQYAKQFYPDLHPELKSLEELSLEFLAHNYDVLFETGKFFALELKPFLQLLYGKTMRFVFCPHGNSDKGHSLKSHAEQDICLVYGDHLRDLLIQNGAMKKISHVIRTGNYRYNYYLSHKTFFDSLTDQLVFSKFQKEKPTILYAPTWQDKENPSSFFSAAKQVIDSLSISYNLLIKLHPFLVEDHFPKVFQMMTQYENHSSVQFLTDFPPIYPLLSRCALYLGDYSSIGYDFLKFNKPLYFLSSSSSPLKTCGIELRIDNPDQFLSAILNDCDQNFSKQRKEIYEYAFGKERSLIDVKKEIFKIILDHKK